MDASDVIRRTQTRVIWNDYRAQKLLPQGGTCPPANCAALNTGCAMCNQWGGALLLIFWDILDVGCSTSKEKKRRNAKGD